MSEMGWVMTFFTLPPAPPPRPPPNPDMAAGVLRPYLAFVRKVASAEWTQQLITTDRNQYSYDAKMTTGVTVLSARAFQR